MKFVAALLRSALILAASALPALAQVQFPSAGNTAVTVPSFVVQCLDANGRAIPAINGGQCAGSTASSGAVAVPTDGIASQSGQYVNAQNMWFTGSQWIFGRGTAAFGAYMDHRGINGVAPSVNSGAMDAGTQRMALATDSPGLTGTGTAGTPNAQVVTTQGITGGGGYGIISDYPVTGAGVSAVPVGATSGNVAAGVASATLAGTSGKTTYIAGLWIMGTGATTGSVISCTLTGVLGGTISIPVAVPTGVTTQVVPIIVPFGKPIPASAANTAIVASCPSFGAGSTTASVSVQGYQL